MVGLLFEAPRFVVLTDIFFFLSLRPLPACQGFVPVYGLPNGNVGLTTDGKANISLFRLIGPYGLVACGFGIRNVHVWPN
jgi:hypothetical protein